MPENYVINLTFSTPLTLDTNCTDVLEVRDGKKTDSHLLATYCSTTARPRSLLSSSENMMVRFATDAYINRQADSDDNNIGFVLYYVAVPGPVPRSKCEGGKCNLFICYWYHVLTEKRV